MPLSASLTSALRFAAVRELSLPRLLKKVRDAYDGRIVLMKGPEVAQLYRVPADRVYGDVDLLVDDAEEAHRCLVAAGFFEVGEPELYRDIHHLRPLATKDSPLAVEFHHAVNWPRHLDGRPRREELLDAAVPSATRAWQIQALRPEHHAVCLALHAWAHEPLARIGDVLDVALATNMAGEDAVLAAARSWGVERVVSTTLACAEHMWGDSPKRARSPLWSRHLDKPRERTVSETHLMKWLVPFSESRPLVATRASAAALLRDCRPVAGEGWPAKIGRTKRALTNAATPRKKYELTLGEQALVGDSVWQRVVERDRPAACPQSD